MLSKTLFLTALPMGMAFVAGAVLPFQATSNAAVARALDHPLWGALTSLLISTIVVIATLIVLRVQAPDIGKAVQSSWWVWIGGILGAVYVGSAAVVTPKLGASGFIVLVVAGQIFVSLLMDHFGLMGLTPKPLNMMKLLGALMILGGVFLVQGVGSTTAAQAIAHSAAKPGV